MRDRGVFILFLAIIGIILIWGVAYPNLSILISSFDHQSHWSLQHYREIFASKLILRAIWNSLWISLVTALGCAIVGGGMAMFFHFLEFPGRRIFTAIAPIPMLLPPLIGVIAFIFLYGESGIIPRSIMRLFSLSSSPWSLNGP